MAKYATINAEKSIIVYLNTFQYSNTFLVFEYQPSLVNTQLFEYLFQL